MTSHQSVARRLRIAVLNRHFGHHFGGAERYAASVVEELATRHEIHVFAQEIDHDFPGVTYHKISRPIAKPRWINQLWFAIETWRLTRRGFDVVHSHENTWHGDIQTVHVRPFRMGLFQGRHGLRRLLRWVSLFTSPRMLTYWYLEAARFRHQPGRRIVAASKSVLDEIQQAFPDTVVPMHIITPGVQIPNKLEDASSARLQLGLPLNPPIALFVGNDFTKKGLDTLLKSLSPLSNLHLAVVGRGQEISIFKRKCRQLQVQDRVHFLGALHDVTIAYEAADMLVHPTTEDTYAMVVLEAMAHDLPVIVSNASYCGIAAELTHGHQALLLDDPLDPKLLEIQINRLMNDPQLQTALRLSGREFAQRRSWKCVGKQHEEIYSAINLSQI